VSCLGLVQGDVGRSDGCLMERGWAVCAAASVGRHGAAAARGDSGCRISAYYSIVTAYSRLWLCHVSPKGESGGRIARQMDGRGYDLAATSADRKDCIARKAGNEVGFKMGLSLVVASLPPVRAF